jgi:hypothetical protein
MAGLIVNVSRHSRSPVYEGRRIPLGEEA